MPPRPGKRHGRLPSGGFTLLEVLVTLLLLGLMAAVVAPVVRGPAPPDEGITTVLSAARETAVRRAQTLELRVDDRGAWRLAATGDSTSIASGQFTDGTSQLRVRVNPLGACFNEGPSNRTQLDALACTLDRNPNGTR